MRISKLITLVCIMALSKDGEDDVVKISNEFNFKQLWSISLERSVKIN